MEHEPDGSYCSFGAEALLARLKVLVREIDGVCKGEDSECIHRMRVASRRLRSAIRLFQECFPGRSKKKWGKQIRRVTRSLGSARDMDVQIEFLKEFLNNLTDPHHRPGIRRLLLRLQQQRKKLQSDVIKVMEELKTGGLLQEMRENFHRIRAHAQLYLVNKDPRQLYQRSYLAISLQLEEFLAYEPYVYQPDRTAELHAMRIAAKRLRYIMEVFAALYQDKLEHPLEVVREIQTMLGNINDCVVWIQYLPQFLEEERVRTFEYFGRTSPYNRLKSGILYMQEDRQRHQMKRYEEFLEFWQQTQSQNIWEVLLQQVLEPCPKANLLKTPSEA